MESLSRDKGAGHRLACSRGPGRERGAGRGEDLEGTQANGEQPIACAETAGWARVGVGS